ncbi:MULTISPECIES: hypothetical protein [unclassified Lentimicrobium]|uniref:hypothetical protein n=1 Tax=unclassified Lentimicrobium TaxID=2677434 RepID=UPI001552A25E|nr:MULTISPECIES: hypothetical protein [unclassified Lentimicrobium]NPD46958.1 hypothetical protein [Lentimicrobium sp. S6]NPD84724.1 hypothetical protein [Lentimicrobium sp. L6]
MIKHLTSILKGVGSLLAVLVLMLFFQSSLTFKHSHYLSDGSIITHAHPFSDSNGTQHTHHKSEITFLSLLIPHADLAQDFPYLDIEITEVFVASILFKNEAIQLMKIPFNALRGPPKC